MLLDFVLTPLLPEIFLTISAMGLLMVGAFQKADTTKIISVFSAIALLLALFVLLQTDVTLGAVMGGMFALDGFSAAVKSFVLIGAVAAICLSTRYLKDENLQRFEYPVLALFATIGMLLMVSSENFLSLYMALELQSLSLYVLAAFRRSGLRSSEAGVKYFTLGALSSGLILFGISLIYGAAGSVAFADVASFAASQGADAMSLPLVIGMVFVISAIGFKVSAAPFHMWTPDVYQGAPSSVTAFFAIVPKLAAVAVLIKLVMGPFYALAEQWQQVVYALSVASMLVGAFAGLVQKNIKRLIAYSSIGNIGYALMGVVAVSPDGVSATFLYLALYMVMTAGAFAVVLSMRRGDVMLVNVSDYAGLSQTRPYAAYAFAALLFSMSGIPPLAGFFGKLAVFQAAIDAELYYLAVIGVVSSVVAAFYYLRVIKVMFFDAVEDSVNPENSIGRRLVLFVSLAVVTLFIFMPSSLIEVTENAAQALMTRSF